MNYWKNKNELAHRATTHTAKMDTEYSAEINEVSANTHMYDMNSFRIDTDVINSPKKEKTEISIVLKDTVSAVVDKNEHVGKTAVLNFSSYKEPGGLFLLGSKAQEECLCHSSFLYNVLCNFESSFYEVNKKNLNKALYQNKALYSPDVVFFDKDGDKHWCDVITCAAPNKKAAQKYCNVSDETNYKVLNDRIDFIYKVAEVEGVDTLILGSYGCGVFGQDINEVAELFIKNLKKYNFKKVIFAVIDTSHKNVFKEKAIKYA